MPKIYGIGAAVVIVGALFKILHLPGANLMFDDRSFRGNRYLLFECL